MRLIERRMEDIRRRMSSLTEDVRALDGVLAKPTQTFEDEFKSQSLANEVEELKSMNRML